jgi:hypothetical protein
MASVRGVSGEITFEVRQPVFLISFCSLKAVKEQREQRKHINALCGEKPELLNRQAIDSNH